MRAYEYTDDRPFEHRATGRYASWTERNEALRDALFGVTLGEHDQRVVGWLSGLDDSTTRVVVGLILRARAAGPYVPPPPDTSADALASPEEIAAIKRREGI